MVSVKLKNFLVTMRAYSQLSWQKSIVTNVKAGSYLFLLFFSVTIKSTVW